MKHWTCFLCCYIAIYYYNRVVYYSDKIRFILLYILLNKIKEPVSNHNDINPFWPCDLVLGMLGSVGWTTLVQTDISQQLLNGLQGNVLKIFMVPKRWTLESLIFSFSSTMSLTFLDWMDGHKIWYRHVTYWLNCHNFGDWCSSNTLIQYTKYTN